MKPTIFDSFEQSCNAHGSKVLFELPGQPAVSFATALERCNRLAAALTSLGVQPGDRVAAQVDKSVDAVLLYLACSQVGGVFLPLNTAYTGAEIDYFLGDAMPRVFVCRDSSKAEHDQRATANLKVESLDDAGGGSLMELATGLEPLTTRVERAMDDAAAILYTSGTTGRSKGAVLTHGNLASNCEALLQAWKYTDKDRLIHALPIFHTHGLFVACNMSLVAGATMIFLTRFNVDEILDLMEQATVLMGVPTFYTRLLQSPRLDEKTTASMRLFVAGSAPLLAEDHAAFASRTGHAILERYGMTETCMIASNPYDGERVAGAVGMPLPGISLKITDRDSGDEVPQGQIGSIEVKGPNVFQGYWNMPEKTASEFRDDGFFITGDLGLIDEQGYLRIVGRDKDLVISGGYNVYPKEIEVLLDELPEVQESAVIGVPHPDLGEGVTAIVVLKPSATMDQQAMLGLLSGKLARYKQPKQLIQIDELPRNVMGKVQKNELRAQFAELYKQ